MRTRKGGGSWRGGGGLLGATMLQTPEATCWPVRLSTRRPCPPRGLCSRNPEQPPSAGMLGTGTSLAFLPELRLAVPQSTLSQLITASP